uniref:Macro domain-containing protein n=1 Tax=Amphilophus citrinellus TaxID=61819 RepID=A0A3Q0SRK2_AMPCI
MDEVKVYCEAGLTVVVGKRSHVEAKLLEFEDTNVKSQASGLSEKQTSRRLGEAKLRLLWREIEQGLGEHFPEVKATQGDAGQLVLEGSVEDLLKVLVCQGDITTQYADALVNAANEDLDHGGGVAAALSKAGGPQVQKESKALVKQTGKISTGDVVVTTGGNLKCKKLLHVVGPVGGKCGGKERALLEKAVRSALDLAEMMEFKSIAMPCISSGLFHVPLTVCSEAIVTAIKEFGSQGGRSLSKIILIDKKGEVVRSMQEACDKILPGTKKMFPFFPPLAGLPVCTAKRASQRIHQ